jgi:hypothetical protein
MNSIACEIGAVFLLAAMLMFGSAHGFIPRSLRSAGAAIVVGVVLVGFLVWRFGPDLYSNFRSTVEWGFPSFQAPPPEASPSGPAPAPHPAKSAASISTSVRQPDPNPTTIVIREVVPAPAEPTPPAAQPIVETLPTGKPIAGKPVQDADAKPAAESSGSSPYDSGVKRAVKSVGSFLHIGGSRKKEPALQ